jgi:thiaminase/transcriptional activator TenA
MFSKETWQKNVSLFEAIVSMSFNRELAQGTLERERFRHYMIQDAHYLEGFARALALLSAKGHQSDHIVQFAESARVAIIVERSLHGEYFVDFGITPEEFASTEPTPVCEHYISYLLRLASLEPFEVGVAGVLPCFWIYREVGKRILSVAARPNPYQRWIDTYSGEEFEKSVDAVIAVVDSLAASASERSVQLMHQAFRRSTQLEWMFWESAYSKATWPCNF